VLAIAQRNPKETIYAEALIILLSERQTPDNHAQDPSKFIWKESMQGCSTRISRSVRIRFKLSDQTVCQPSVFSCNSYF
jgi:hypothetical protein